MNGPGKIQGRVALVTGGGTGIGKAAAIRLAQEGAGVAVTGRRPEFIQETVEEITSAGGRALAIAADVALAANAPRALEQTLEAFGRLDILVNNAGVFRGGPLEEATDGVIDLLIDINLRGLLDLTRAAIPELKKTRGQIVNVASGLAARALPGPGCAVYAATKGAVETLTRSLAVELAPAGVRVNAVSPAMVETPIYEAFMPKGAVGAAMENMAALHPLGRMGQPEEIAEAILFLLTSAWTTGAILRVDGGFTAV